MLLYQELLRTQPWDTLLALAVIGVVVIVPIIVSIGLRIQERRSEEERPIPWLTVISREPGATATPVAAEARGKREPQEAPRRRAG